MRLWNVCLGLLAFALAMAIWLPCLHIFFRKPLSDFYRENGISPKARQLAARHLQLWTEPTWNTASVTSGDAALLYASVLGPLLEITAKP